MKKVYADCNATTPLLQVVKEYLLNRVDGPFSNPNALHSLGQQINQSIEKCRSYICENLFLESEKDRLIFTSGSSESISTAFWMSIGANILSKKSKKMRIICSTIEHACVIESAKFWEKRGAIIHWVNCNADGIIETSQVKNLLTSLHNEIALVAIMAANNETGAIQSFEEIAELCYQHNVYYLCDTTQIIGKIKISKELLHGSFLCCSSHKLGAPLGSGFLFLPHKENFHPLIHGGGQEKSLRSGTQNYLGIESMTIAIDYHLSKINYWNELLESKLKFEKTLIEMFQDKVKIISKKVLRLHNTSLISFPGIHGQGIQIELESKNVFVTTSAACGDNEPETSHVLKAMGSKDEEGRSVIRVSTGLENCLTDYDVILNALSSAYNTLNKIR